ncbi:MAG: efflux RND transporter permease subunit [Planctomycetes bacterium]|nr:efflux RND transporter permease subunit [Planctomycetota bacterium]
MNLAEFAVKNRAFTYFACVLLAVAGVASFFGLGQLEDPEFSIKNAVISTRYPGASPEEVELEVTDRIEIALQELPQLDFVESWSRAGESLVNCEIKQEFWSDRLPQVWDEMRRKINDLRPSLPPGVMDPVISDDVGDVFGFQLAVVGDGFTAAEMEEYAKLLRKELSVVEDVARADLWGVQQRVIYLDVSETQLAALGLSDSSIENTLREQNMVVDGGNVDVQDRRLRITPTGAFDTPEDIGDLSIRPSLTDSLQAGGGTRGQEQSSELIRIRDIGTVSEGYREPAFTQMRFNGRPAIGISITNVSGANVVTVGQAIDRRLDELVATLPVGIEVRKVHWMSDVVAGAVNGFLVSFAQAVGIVIVVLTLAMGLRMSLVIGSALIMTILGSFILMAILGVDLQRMSLGALIIALGMMVDNAVVVADGMVVRMQKGMDRTKAAIEAASQPSMPLLGATVIGAMAFYPIFASPANAGEYCRTLFTVVAIALLVSWVVSVTLTPLQCIGLLKDPKDDGGDPYGGGLFRRFRGLLEWCIRMRWLTIGAMVALLFASFVGFGFVTQLFFPDSSMNKFMIDIYATQGTRIEQVSADLEEAEDKLLADERIEDVASFIGAGPPRFYLPVAPESPNQSYAQLIVNVRDFRGIDALIAELGPRMRAHFTDSLVSMRKYGVGPSNTWAFEVRFSGPAIADPDDLRRLGEQGMDILRDHPMAGPVRTDWRERVPRLEPLYSQERARWASVTRDDLARTTVRAFDGRSVGTYREQDNLLPIVLRYTEEERRNFTSLDVLQVQPAGSTTTIPLLQVTDGVDVAFEDPVIGRRDRRRTITVQSNPAPGFTLPQMREAVLADFDAVELPPGYKMEWGGEHEDTVKAQQGLVPGVVPAVVIILLIIVALFNAYRPPLVILLTIPFAMIGMTVGLLAFNVPFGFVALLAAMSLVGMMIKNAIVLLDEVNAQIGEGSTQYDAIIYAALSRLRPVVLAAATTVLGVVPLLKDVFWIGLAVTIMAGLSFGTVLTMVLVPVLYATLFRLRRPAG